MCSAEVARRAPCAGDLLTRREQDSYDLDVRRSLLHVAVLLALAGAPLVIGCGAAARPLAPASSASSARVEGPSVRERELEGRLALAEAEVLELRDRQRLAEAESRRRTVRI